MATGYRGRSGARSRTTTMWGGFSGFTSTGGSRRTRTSRSTGSKKRTTTGASPAAYRSVTNALEKKIQSFRTLINQTKGPAKYGRPSPATINTFANWISKGAIVQTVSPTQVAKWAKACKINFNVRNPSTTACKNVLCAKFGKNVIKAVARAKNGSFMVATAPTFKGRAFTFPR